MGSGGYRYGAGRPGYKVKAEHCLRLDVRDLVRARVLGSIGYTGWRWTDQATGESRSSIGIVVAADYLTLRFSANDEPVQQHVGLERTACNFGGNRPWLLCPLCSRRIGVLFLRGGRFKCRKCARASYSSQSEDAMGRAWRLQRKLEARLGNNWARPKGMHHRTRQRLMERIFGCEEARDNELALYMQRRSIDTF